MWGGADLHENQLFIEKQYFRPIWPFWDLLDLKNGSGSKFRLKWWYREVWKPKIKLFHDKNMKLQIFVFTTVADRESLS